MADFINTVDVIGDDALTDSIINRSITEYRDNSVTSIIEYAFSYCSNLTVVDVPSVTTIKTPAFEYCSKLVTVILRNNAVCTLNSSNAFSGTPISSGTGYIYVPRALVDTYKAASNWSTFASKFRALEDYTVDGTTTGELDPTKI